MYQLSDKQVDYIFNDISARGIKNEDLQYNLVDHVCCIIERNFKENGDFEEFYLQTISSFYKKNLFEIEEETHLLINFKNYYTMKKIMNISGLLAVLFSISGIVLKFLWLPGAGATLILGFSIFSLFFLPMVFAIKVKQNKSLNNKLTYFISTICGSLLTLSILFKMMHWPGANIMGLTSIIVLFFVFVPMFYLNGIKNEETKQQTIITSVILILACALLLALINVKAMRGVNTEANHTNVNTTNLLELNKQVAENKMNLIANDSLQLNSLKNALSIYKNLEEIKSEFLKKHTNDIKYNNSETWHELKNISIFETESENQLTEIKLLGIDKLYAKLKPIDIKINNQNFLLNTNLSEQDWYNYYFNKQNLEQILQNITYIQNCLFKG
ncbi:MAG: hypothetical protein LCH32_04230 [Bacteroidetes bacterium]|nr:hypothetical protein [Bacteroidota bacterium]